MDDNRPLWRAGTPPDRYPPDLDLLNQIAAFLTQWPGAAWGPAHLVLSDFNLLDPNLAFCLHATRRMTPTPTHPADELAATLAFLSALQAIPSAERERVQIGYTGEWDP